MIYSNFSRWTSLLDLDKVLAITNRRSWIFTVILCAAIIFSFSSLPLLNDFFGLQPFIPSIILIAAAIIAWAGSDEKLRARLGVKKHLILTFFVTGSFQTLLWSWCIFSTASSAPMMAAFPLLCIAYHCEIFLFSRNYHWALIPAFGAMAIALVLSPSPTHSTIVLIGGLLAVSGSYIMGSNALIQINLKHERNDLKEALDASTLMDSVNEAEKTKGVLYEILGANHDANNALTSLMMNLEFLLAAIKNKQKHSDEEIEVLTKDTQASLEKLSIIHEKSRNMGKQAHLRELVNVKEQLETLAGDFQNQFNDKQINLSLDMLGEASLIRLHGGNTTLHRIFSNLVKNACEGNGTKSASEVDITAKVVNNNLEIEVADNGPGFSNEILNSTLFVVQSSKVHGSGLGLYTCKRLVAANKGEIEIANNANGGATVTVRLPLTD